MLALMGFHVSPVGFLSPPRQLQEHFGAIQNPLPLGRAAGDNILQFILFTGGGKQGPNREPTVEL